MLRYLPVDGLPPTDYPPNEVREWMFEDTVERYKKQGGHPVYGEHDILYRFNSLGYRCPEFDTEADIRVLAIGCSYVMGSGLAQEHLFHERFAAQLRVNISRSVVSWNLGVCGASNDYIARLLLLAVPRLDPHIVLVNFTHLTRREHISVENRLIKYGPSFRPRDEVHERIFSHYHALTSPPDDLLCFFKNYKTVELVLSDRCWLFSHVAPREFESIADQMDLRRYVGPLSYFDRGRDGAHPGPESNRILAQRYWDKFVQFGGPKSIPSIRCGAELAPR